MNISPPDDQKRAKERLETLLLEGLNSGDPIPVYTEFWPELKREAIAKLEPRKRTGKADRSQF